MISPVNGDYNSSVDRAELNPSEFNVVYTARNEWRKSIVQNGGINTPVVTELINRMYAVCKIPPPKVYRFGSPLACILAIPYLSGLHGTGYYESAILKILKGPQLHNLGARFVGRNASDRQGDDRWDRLADLLQVSMELPIKAQINDSFIENFKKDLLEATGGICKAEKIDILTDKYQRLSGRDRDVYENSRMRWWMDMARTGLYWWPYRNFAVVSEYPKVWHRGLRDIPHHESEAAIQFPDDYKLWVWQGVQVTAQIIAFPETITIKQIREENNSEVQRIMISRMGAGKYLKETNCELVDMDSMTLQGSAPRALMRDDLGNMWLVGTDGSTARVYTMAVPPDVSTCKEAHERICGFGENRLIAEA